LQQRTGDKNVALADYFDLIAGTSTGGILTCFYLLPPAEGEAKHSRYSANEAIELYTKRGKEIFKKKTSFFGLANEIYPTTGLENILKEKMGDITFAQTRKSCIITAYDITERKAVLFTSPQARQNSVHNYLLRDVARATSAAPTYFEPAAVQSLGKAMLYLVDGGMYANNPTMCAWVEANKSTYAQCAYPEIKDLYIVSIGTGKEKQKYNYKKAKDWGLLGWARPVVDILLSSSAEVINYQMHQLFKVAKCSENYVRLDPALGKAKPDMDNVKDENIKNLQDAGYNFIQNNLTQLDKIVDKLLENGSSL
jgi:patatin-like phospholipase/acyl hydrolase